MLALGLRLGVPKGAHKLLCERPRDNHPIGALPKNILNIFLLITVFILIADQQKAYLYNISNKRQHVR